MDKWTDGQCSDRQTDGWMDKEADGWKVEKEERTDELMDGQTNGQTDRRIV